jgi:hypothetical protein
MALTTMGGTPARIGKTTGGIVKTAMGPKPKSGMPKPNSAKLPTARPMRTLGR